MTFVYRIKPHRSPDPTAELTEFVTRQNQEQQWTRAVIAQLQFRAKLHAVKFRYLTIRNDP